MMREAKVEGALVDGAAARGGMCLKLNPLWCIGIPDRLVLLPGGQAIFVELKRPDGALRKKQRFVGAKLSAMGFRVEVLWNVEQVQSFLSQF